MIFDNVQLNKSGLLSLRHVKTATSAPYAAIPAAKPGRAAIHYFQGKTWKSFASREDVLVG